MGRLHDLIEKFESDDENAFKSERQHVRGGFAVGVRFFLQFIGKNWLLLLAVIFAYMAMVNSIEANKYAQRAYDSAADANYNARKASGYAEDAADYASDAADYARDAERAAEEASLNAMLY